MHKPSKDTYDFIAQWVAPDFFFSKTDSWGRMGVLGPLVDLLLTCLPVGEVVDIGVGESSIYLSKLARKFKRKIYHCDVEDGKIRNPLTVPGYLYPEALDITEHGQMYTFGRSNFFMGRSDDLFNLIAGEALAFTLIDGDHTYEQAKRDFNNAVNLTVDNGYIAMHDTYPPSEGYLHESRCGGVYKLRQEIELDRRFDSLTLVHGTAMDVGLTLVRKKPAKVAYFQE